MIKSKRSLLKASACTALCTSFLLASCDLSPNYKEPKFVVPDQWEGQAPFAKANPTTVDLKQDWWTDYKDKTLNALEAKALKENADLQAAGERFLQARAITTKIRAQLLPHLNIDSGAGNYRQSDDRLFRPGSDGRNGGGYEPSRVDSEDYAGLASWEPDFWSSIRNRVRMGRLEAQATGADFAQARLSLEGEVARDYIQLRQYDAQIFTYQQSIKYYESALAITQDQLDNQAAPMLDVQRAKAQLFSTKADLYDVQGSRAVVEHALAILCNDVPASFHITPAKRSNLPHPSMPVLIPSTLLERRPDLAAAERRMAAASKAIGVARAAFFPHVVFRLTGGFEGGDFNLASLANSLWSYGGRAAIPIFEGGLRRAELQRSWSAYREERDNYRSAVLRAFKEVEDNLSLVDRLSHESQALGTTVKADMSTQDMTMVLYQGGAGTYLEAIVSQENTLRARINQVDIAAREYLAEVNLLVSLGGGWNKKQMPAFNKILSVNPVQYTGLDHGKPMADIDSAENPKAFENLNKPFDDTSTSKTK